MRKTKFILFVMMALLAVASCTNESVEESTLSLSEEGSLDLPKQSSEQSIIVTTNEASWTSFVNVDWIDVEQDLNSLTLLVKENPGVTERKAELLVIAGKAACKLSLVQSASSVELELSKEEEVIDQWGDKFTIDVNTNSTNWVVEQEVGTEEWLSVLSKVNSKEIVITVSENTLPKPREAVITVIDKTSNKSKEIVVKQEGSMYYKLPLLDPMVTESAVIEYENANKSYRMLDTTFLNNGVLAFGTKNPLFPHVQYYMGNTYVKKVVILVDGEDFFVDKDFYKMFEDNGFKYVSGDDVSKKYNKSVTIGKQPFEISAEIYKSAKKGVSGVVYVNITPMEPAGMSTYSQLLLGYTEFNGITKAKIDEWEAANDGIYNKLASIEKPDASGRLAYTYVASPPYYYRTYNFKNGKFVSTWLLFRDIPKFYYEFDGVYYMTGGYYDLLKANGFFADETDEYGFDCFNNKTKKIRLEIKVSPFEGFGTGEPLVEIYLRPL